jgi:hypothetical protein
MEVQNAAYASQRLKVVGRYYPKPSFKRLVLLFSPALIMPNNMRSAVYGSPIKLGMTKTMGIARQIHPF